jgi:hypothetical protein
MMHSLMGHLAKMLNSKAQWFPLAPHSWALELQWAALRRLSILEQHPGSLLIPFRL